ncbi:MAG: IPT/TIG domain-containing protein [Methanoregula sp.]|jgi:hypothetical protein
MKNTVKCGLILGLILFVGVFFAGCSDQSSSGTYTPVPTITTPTVLYTAGDIAAKTASQSPYWLIISYDKTTDLYSRAQIYKNTDGSWGHRNDAVTYTLDRASMEKLYPVKVSHVVLTSVPIVTPTAATPVPTTYSGTGPRITKVSPTSAGKDTLVSLTITGTNFLSGATVSVVQPGFPTIQATGVSVTSSSQITCMANLNGLDAGSASIRVTNPDGRYDSLDNVFLIGAVAPGISTVSPITGALGQTISLAITGTNFEDAVQVTLTTGTTQITCANTQVTPPTSVLCTLTIPSTAMIGSYNVAVRNIDSGKSGTWSSTFSITNST